ncbi:MAG: four helix bundle protein [Bacteroidia bacterium]
MHNFKELKVWQKSRILVKDVYLISKSFPKDEQFGITSQIRRAVISVSNNIAEGSGRNTKGKFKQFLVMAYGSALELGNLLILCLDLEMIQELKFNNLHNLNNRNRKDDICFNENAL